MAATDRVSTVLVVCVRVNNTCVSLFAIQDGTVFHVVANVTVQVLSTPIDVPRVTLPAPSEPTTDGDVPHDETTGGVDVE